MEHIGVPRAISSFYLPKEVVSFNNTLRIMDGQNCLTALFCSGVRLKEIRIIFALAFLLSFRMYA